MDRYGRGGSYWTNQYPQQFGQAAVPLPITHGRSGTSPTSTIQSGGDGRSKRLAEYAQLLQISHDAITSEDPQATIVTAGILTNRPNAFDFLDDLYSVPGIKGDFDVLALHAYEGRSTRSTPIYRWLAK